MVTADDNGNGRITLAVIGTKLDRLIADVNEIKHNQECTDKLVVKHDERISDHDGEIDRLRTQSTGWNIVNSLAIALAAWLGLRP